MLEWKTPDIQLLRECEGMFSVCRMGSDTSPANIYLLRRKYDTMTAVTDGALLRYYSGKKPNREGYGFPLCAKGSDYGAVFGAMKRDSEERGVKLGFCLCDERQKAVIDEYLSVEWSQCDDDSDYIYKRDSLAALSGKKLHRKRNHINSFMKIYDDVHFEPLTSANAADALYIAEEWVKERGDNASADELDELRSIREGLNNMHELGIFGGVLYVEGNPAAMTAASAISEVCVDVHYEKAIGEYAENGAFTVINQSFVSSDAVTAEYINREEDMGIAGLRTAKESYYPAFKLKKYYGVCKC